MKMGKMKRDMEFVLRVYIRFQMGGDSKGCGFQLLHLRRCKSWQHI